jgi:hypothetical protein
LIRKINHVACLHGEGNSIVKTVAAATRKNINEGVAMSANALHELAAVRVMSLDNGDYILNNERLFQNIIFLHSPHLRFDSITFFLENQ